MSSKKLRAGSVASRHVEVLEQRMHAYRPADRAPKQAALEALAGLPIRDAGTLVRYHEALCFLRAYPDDATILRLVETALEGFAARVAALRPGRGGSLHPLDETGIAGTTVYCALSYAAARWLAQRFPGAVELDGTDPELEARIGPLLPVVSPVSEEEALVEVGVPYRAWLRAARPQAAQTDLEGIVQALGRGPAAARALYDVQEPRLRWALGEGPASRTRARLAVPRPFFHAEAACRAGPPGQGSAGHPVAFRAARPAEARAALETARVGVLTRYREVHAFNFADPASVVFADVGRGVRVVWLGVLPAYRLPLRAHFGYLLLKNGVPVGYGDASCLFEWVGLAFNIFESYRQGESAFIYAGVLAFLARRLAIRTVLVSRYQIGHENDEALASGAFWFYYKLGFRPRRPDLAALATAERRRRGRDPAYRSSRETLERLAGDAMVLELGGAADPAVVAFDVRRVGLAAARAAARDGARLPPLVAGRRGGAGARADRPAERRARARLAPFLAAIPDLASWPSADQRALAEVIRAKAGRSEERYLRRLRALPRLRRSLLELGGPG